jgi:hypothetical protein
MTFFFVLKLFFCSSKKYGINDITNKKKLLMVLLLLLGLMVLMVVGQKSARMVWLQVVRIDVDE